MQQKDNRRKHYFERYTILFKLIYKREERIAINRKRQSNTQTHVPTNTQIHTHTIQLTHNNRLESKLIGRRNRDRKSRVRAQLVQHNQVQQFQQPNGSSAQNSSF